MMKWQKYTQFPYILESFGSAYKCVVHVQKYHIMPTLYVRGCLTVNKTDFPEKLLKYRGCVFSSCFLFLF